MQFISDKLGEGAQGCVLRGTIALSSDSRNYRFYQEGKDLSEVGKVTKLLLDRQTFLKEIESTRIANALDKGKFSMEITAYSILNQQDIQTIMKENHRVLEKIKLCKAISDAIKSIKYLYQLIYKYEGVSVYSMKVPLEQMIEYCFNLYEGLKLYQSKKFIHNDIKDDNILFADNRLIFIDFGMSSYIRDTDLSYTSYMINEYKDYYLYQPPELIAYAITKYSTLEKEEMFSFFKTVYEHNLISRRSLSYSYKTMIINNIYDGNQAKYMNALRALFEHMYRLTPEMRESYMRRKIHYIDIYKLSFTMLDIFERNNYIQQNPFLTSQFYMNVIFKALTINPSERPSIDKLCATYETFLKPASKVYISPSSQLKSRKSRSRL